MRILHAIHDFLPRHCAGSEIYAFDLCRTLADRGHQVHVLCAEYDPARPHGSLNWRWHEGVPVTEVVNNWSFGSFAETYASPHIDAVLEHVLSALQPDVVHVHNLLNLSFQLPLLAASRGIPSVATLHEYALLCPSGGQRVHLAGEHVCSDIDTDRCARCFRQSPFYSQAAFAQLARTMGHHGLLWRIARRLRDLAPRLQRLGTGAATRAAQWRVSPAEIDQRLDAARHVFETIDLFVAPSPALGRDFQRFGLPADRLEVSDYGFEPLPSTEPVPGEGRLHIGFVGTLVWHKGVHVLIDAVRRLPEGSWQLTLYGSTDTFPDYCERLQQAAAGLPIHFAGGFDRHQVSEVYAAMDVLVVPSLWPENSPLVIHEAFMAGVPVVGSRTGGTADLLDNQRGGLLYEAFSAEALAMTLRRLIDEPDLGDQLVTAIPPVKSLAEDACQWESRYRAVLDRHRPSMEAP